MEVEAQIKAASTAIAERLHQTLGGKIHPGTDSLALRQDPSHPDSIPDPKRSPLNGKVPRSFPPPLLTSPHPGATPPVGQLGALTALTTATATPCGNPSVSPGQGETRERSPGLMVPAPASGAEKREADMEVICDSSSGGGGPRPDLFSADHCPIRSPLLDTAETSSIVGSDIVDGLALDTDDDIEVDVTDDPCDSSSSCNYLSPVTSTMPISNFTHSFMGSNITKATDTLTHPTSSTLNNTPRPTQTTTSSLKFSIDSILGNSGPCSTRHTPLNIPAAPRLASVHRGLPTPGGCGVPGAQRGYLEGLSTLAHRHRLEKCIEQPYPRRVEEEEEEMEDDDQEDGEEGGDKDEDGALLDVRDGDRFSWLQCTRYKPPKLPRSKKKEGVKKRKLGRNPRVPFTQHQVTVLEQKFRQTHYLSSVDVAELSAALNLTETRVKIWFQNRRARERRDRESGQERGKGSPPATDGLPPVSTAASQPLKPPTRLSPGPISPHHHHQHHPHLTGVAPVTKTQQHSPHDSHPSPAQPRTSPPGSTHPRPPLSIGIPQGAMIPGHPAMMGLLGGAGGGPLPPPGMIPAHAHPLAGLPWSMSTMPRPNMLAQYAGAAHRRPSAFTPVAFTYNYT